MQCIWVWNTVNFTECRLKISLLSKEERINIEGKSCFIENLQNSFFLLRIWTASLSLLSKQPESCRQPLLSKKSKWSDQRGLKTTNKKEAQEGNCLKTESSEIPMWIDRSKFFHHIYNLISLYASHFTHVKYKKFHHRRYCYIWATWGTIIPPQIKTKP